MALLGSGLLTVGCGLGDAPAEAGEPSAASTTPVPLGSSGDSLYREGDFEGARASYESALAEARSRGDVRAEARLRTSLGLAAWRLGDYKGARRHGEDGLALKRSRGLDSLLFRSHNALGLLAWSESRFFDAIDHYEAAFEVAGRTGDTVGLAKASNNLALVLNDIGDFAGALEYFTEAFEGARAVGDTLTQARSLNNLGMVAHQVGDPQGAIQHLQHARRLYAEIGDVTGDQNALGQLGSVYATLGSPGEAIFYLDSALSLARRHGLRQEEASNLELLAGVYSDAGDAERALRLLEKAAALDRELGLDYEAGVVLRHRAWILGDLGAHAEAFQAASEALELHEGIQASREQLSDLVLLTELAEEMDDPEEADRQLLAAEALAREAASRAARVEVALARARLAEARSEWRGVIRALADLEGDLTEGGFREEWEAAALRARAFRRLGLLEEAVESGRRAVRATERVRSGYGSGALRTSFLAARQRTYLELVLALLATDNRDEAFQVADRARGRALVEHLAGGPGRKDSGSGALRRLTEGARLLRQINTLVVRLDEVREWGGGEEAELELAAELQRKRTEYEDLLAGAPADGNAAGFLAAGGADPGRVAGVLAPDEALLQYLVGDERLLLFVVTREGLQVLDIPSRRESLSSRIRLARELLSRPGAGAWADGGSAGPSAPAVLERLHELLLGGARDEGLLQGRSRLIVVPHAELTYVPFGALVDPTTKRWVAADRVLVHLPASAALPLLRSADGGGGRAAGRGAVAFAPYPDDLPATGAEVEAVERGVKGARLRIGRRATEARFREALAEAAVVHAATHGVLNRLNPMFTRIELAANPNDDADPQDDGRFELHELMDVRLPGNLVFLSGCETGLGTSWSTDFAPGEDYATLAQAFLHAGAGSVVATLWRIEDEGAAAFAEAFYAALRERDPAGALAEARETLMKSERFSAPFHWAGYRLSGGQRHIPNSIRKTDDLFR